MIFICTFFQEVTDTSHVIFGKHWDDREQVGARLPPPSVPAPGDTTRDTTITNTRTMRCLGSFQWTTPPPSSITSLTLSPPNSKSSPSCYPESVVKRWSWRDRFRNRGDIWVNVYWIFDKHCDEWWIFLCDLFFGIFLNVWKNILCRDRAREDSLEKLFIRLSLDWFRTSCLCVLINI